MITRAFFLSFLLITTISARPVRKKTKSPKRNNKTSNQNTEKPTIKSTQEFDTIKVTEKALIHHLEVHKNTNLNGNLDVEHDVHIEEDLTVDGKSCFKKNVAIKHGAKLFVNEINPASTTHSCKEDDTGTTTFSGNVAIVGETCFNNNVAIKSPNILYVSEINPSNGLCGTDDNLTTTFSGFVHINKDLSFPESTPDDGLIKVLDPINTDQFHTFIHNYGLDGITDGNTFLGIDAGNLTLTGTNNTALGYQSLSLNTTGSGNTAVGHQSLNANTTGINNSALGMFALDSLVSGTNNIALGYNAGSSYTSSESNNIVIGHNGVNTEASTIRIGTVGIQTSCYIAGITSNTNNHPVVTYNPTTGQLFYIDEDVLDANYGSDGGEIIPSSRRYKKDINDINEASAQLIKLRPVSFKYKNKPEDAPREYGLIAEEVATIYPELVNYKDGQPDSVKYHALPALLLNEYHQQQKTIDKHDTQFDILNNHADLQDNQIAEIIKRLTEIEIQLGQSKKQ